MSPSVPLARSWPELRLAPARYQHMGRRLEGRPVSSRVWDAWAADGLASLPVLDDELAFFAHHTAQRQGRLAVDAGCGTGAFSRCLRDFGYHVRAVDSSPLSLSLARERGHGLGLAYQQHDLTSGPPCLPGGGCDVVVARLVAPYLDDPLRWLHQVRGRWLRPGGSLYLVVALGQAGALLRGQLPFQAAARLCQGWEGCARYDLGALTCFFLSSPA